MWQIFKIEMLICQSMANLDVKNYLAEKVPVRHQTVSFLARTYCVLSFCLFCFELHVN